MFKTAFIRKLQGNEVDGVGYQIYMTGFFYSAWLMYEDKELAVEQREVRLITT